MSKSPRSGTPVYARQHSRGLTLPQLNAVDLLAAGKTDTETAALLGLSRTCVTKWRLYDPIFQAALNIRRAEVWGVGADRLRSLIPKAIDALAEELDDPDSPNRVRVALDLLRLVPPAAPTIGPTDPDEIVRRLVEECRERAPDPLSDEIMSEDKGLPPLKQHITQAWREIEARLAEPEALPAPAMTALPACGDETSGKGDQIG
jgi:hypothetical protein